MLKNILTIRVLLWTLFLALVGAGMYSKSATPGTGALIGGVIGLMVGFAFQQAADRRRKD